MNYFRIKNDNIRISIIILIALVDVFSAIFFVSLNKWLGGGDGYATACVIGWVITIIFSIYSIIWFSDGEYHRGSKNAHKNL